jgi:NAD(P)-dependent dehydrogenase (short-subunit alcohol dehydrogenase family)
VDEEMSERIDFDGRVIVVTGAGRGLGAAHAKELAARGARVVVNDLGGDTSGGGGSPGPAEEVVAEIEAAGGTATADSTDIGEAAGCAALVDRAVATYGRLDGVLHNAGIIRPAPLEAVGEPEFDRMLRIHLYGAFNLTARAWPHLAETKGRILYITSAVGLFGAPFMGTYAAAKTGLIGLTRTGAIEGGNRGVGVNALGVAGATRLMLDQMERLPDLHAWFLKYMNVGLPAAAAVWLLHPDCPANGRIFEAWGPHMSEVLIAETRGLEMFDATPEEYRDRFAELERRDEVIFPAGFADFHDKMFKFIEDAGAEPLSAAARGAFIPPSDGEN